MEMCIKCGEKGQYKNNTLCKKCYNKEWYEENKEKKLKQSKEYHWKNREKVNAYHRALSIKRKLELLSHYSNGDIRCQCCGEKRIEFLSIDHINGRTREDNYSSSNLFYRLRKLGWPGGYRVLCFNCNLSIGIFGYCPHEKEKIEVLQTEV
jgi:hypothetical protein